MLAKDETQTGLIAEMKIVPAWAWALAAIVFVAAQWYFNVAISRQANPPPVWSRPLLGILAGIAGACYLLFIGYVNRDAKRRGMSPLLWTIVAMIIPNALGIILYFLMRQPLRSACPRCGNTVQPGFNFCPRCNHKLSPSCRQCQRLVGENDVYCPYCGTSLHEQAASANKASTPTPR